MIEITQETLKTVISCLDIIHDLSKIVNDLKISKDTLFSLPSYAIYGNSDMYAYNLIYEILLSLDTNTQIETLSSKDEILKFYESYMGYDSIIESYNGSLYYPEDDDKMAFDIDDVPDSYIESYFNIGVINVSLNFGTENVHINNTFALAFIYSTYSILVEWDCYLLDYETSFTPTENCFNMKFYFEICEGATVTDSYDFLGINDTEKLLQAVHAFIKNSKK